MVEPDLREEHGYVLPPGLFNALEYGGG
jgi:hypothetical protein